MSDMISRKAAIELRDRMADIIGAAPLSSIHSALCEYANAIRALPSVGVTVKSLEWSGCVDTRLKADVYSVRPTYGQGAKDFLLARSGNVIGWFDDTRAAQNAAQADYEARILSALDVQPAPNHTPNPATEMRDGNMILKKDVIALIEAMPIQSAAFPMVNVVEAVAAIRALPVVDVQPAPMPLANWRDPNQWAAAAEYLTSQPAPDVAQVRARVSAAIFDPGATEGYKGDRSLTQWQTDAVMRAMIKTPPAPSPDVAAKLKAAEDYANEITANGSRRIDNITGLFSDKQADHIRTQIDLAFKAGWHAALTRKGGA